MAEALKNVFTIEELELIKTSFAKADIDKDKALSLREFKTIVANSKLDATDTSHLFALFDTNADGKITFAEFVTALSVMTRGTPKQKLEFLFDFYDTDSDGVLTSAEIRIFIGHVKKVVGSLLGPDLEHQAGLEAEAIVKKLDVNNDGKISRAEWIGFSSMNTNLLEIFGME